MADDRRFYGYRLRSEVDLAGLLPLSPGGPPDICLHRGDIPRTLGGAVWSSPFVEIDSAGAVLVRASEGLRFLVRAGESITLDAPPGTATGEIEAFLFGVVAGILLHQRRDLALHASGVAIDGQGVAFAGPSGRGKSTLAATLMAAGHGLITDDICRVAFAGDRPFAMPGPSRLRLWPDAAQALGKTDMLEEGRPGHGKRLLPGLGEIVEPVPLRAVIRLAIDRRRAGMRIERLSGPAAVMPAEDLLYRARLGRLLGGRIDLFLHLIRLGAAVPVFRLTRDEGPVDLAGLMRLVLSATETGG